MRVSKFSRNLVILSALALQAAVSQAGPATALALEESNRKSDRNMKIDPKDVRMVEDSEVARLANKMMEDEAKKKSKGNK